MQGNRIIERRTRRGLSWSRLLAAFLDSDLSNCPGSGVVIGNNDITFDLGGHVIDGVGTGAGVDNGAGYDRVTIRNGTTREFAVGVFLTGAQANRVANLRTGHNGFFGVYLGGSSDTQLSHISAFRNPEAGIQLSSSADNRVERSTLSENGAGVLLIGSDRNTVVDSSALRGGDGISLSQSARNRIERNFVSGNSFGIAVEFAASELNEIQGNSVSGNGTGIFLGKTQQPDLVFVANQAIGNAQDGIAVLEGSRGTVVEHNLASRNGDDGIDVDEPQTTITRNTALHNVDLGIEAVLGVTDGGGNRAAGNGNPAQCTNVACS